MISSGILTFVLELLEYYPNILKQVASLMDYYVERADSLEKEAYEDYTEH